MGDLGYRDNELRLFVQLSSKLMSESRSSIFLDSCKP